MRAWVVANPTAAGAPIMPRSGRRSHARLDADFQAESGCSVRSAVPQHQLAFPAERMADDGRQVVALGLPAEQRAGAVGRGDDLRRIAGAANAEVDAEIDAGHLLHGVDHL